MAKSKQGSNKPKTEKKAFEGKVLSESHLEELKTIRGMAASGHNVTERLDMLIEKLS